MTAAHVLADLSAMPQSLDDDGGISRESTEVSYTHLLSLPLPRASCASRLSTTTWATPALGQPRGLSCPVMPRLFGSCMLPAAGAR